MHVYAAERQQRQVGDPVQPRLESNPANRNRYTGSSAVITRAEYPTSALRR